MNQIGPHAALTTVPHVCASNKTVTVTEKAAVCIQVTGNGMAMVEQEAQQLLGVADHIAP